MKDLHIKEFKRYQVEYECQLRINANLIKETEIAKDDFRKLYKITCGWCHSTSRTAKCVNDQIPAQAQAILGGDLDMALAIAEECMMDPVYQPGEYLPDTFIKTVDGITYKTNRFVREGGLDENKNIILDRYFTAENNPADPNNAYKVLPKSADAVSPANLVFGSIPLDVSIPLSKPVENLECPLIENKILKNESSSNSPAEKWRKVISKKNTKITKKLSIAEKGKATANVDGPLPLIDIKSASIKTLKESPKIKIDTQHKAKSSHGSKSTKSASPSPKFLKTSPKPSRVDKLETQITRMADMVQKLIVSQSTSTADPTSARVSLKAKPEKPRKCYHCGNRGHMANDCKEETYMRKEEAPKVSPKPRAESPKKKDRSKSPKKWIIKADKAETPLEPIQKWVPKKN